MRLSENTAVVVADALNVTASFATAGNGANMKNYNRCRVILLITASGDAAATVTLLQGSSGTAVSTSLAFTEYLKNEDMETNLATWTKVSASTATALAGASGNYGYIWEIKADQLDTDTFGSENTYVRCNVTATGGNVTAAALIYELYEPRDMKGADGAPSAS